ncbi:hypothetical protein EIP86_003925 [Pleurotus ostreatoroseus]|nr:hypothetical protein EIP86_003925 [Pleurotus ostreatoroseus]
MYYPWKLAAALLSLTVLVHARLPHNRGYANSAPRPSVPIVSAEDVARTDQNGSTLPPITTVYYFDQLIDHTNPSLGTFQQRYWTTWEWYESGGPIVLFTPGEANAEGYTGYLVNGTINGQIAQQELGATVVLEHRYFGQSNPFSDLSVGNLEYHTISQAVADLIYFAENVQLPMPGGDSVSAKTTPWVLVGGSYSGALTAWTMSIDFWAYFEPIRQFMPQNCSADIQAVIAHVDQVFTNGTSSDIEDLKEQFNLQTLQHLDDAAGALRNNIWDWQDLQPESGPGQSFFEFCDALEVQDGQVAGLSGFGMTTALRQWSEYWNNEYFYDICGDATAEDCFGTYDPTSYRYTNTALDNPTRSWNWLVCNEVGFFQDGAPANQSSIVSRLIQPVYDERQCTYMFPDAFNGTPTPNVGAINTAYSGWSMQTPNVFFANGQRDPWRDATVSADGGTSGNTSSLSIGVSDGFHCSDLVTQNGLVDDTVLKVQQQGLFQIKTWLQDSVSDKKRAVKFAREY